MKLNGALIVAAGLLSVLSLVWFRAEHGNRLRLTEEHAALESQLADMTALVASNQELSNRLAAAERRASAGEQPRELLRLRGEAGLLRQQIKDLEAVRKENRQAHAELETTANHAAPVAASADYWPKESWAFAGYASPDAALQTSIWAANNGDLKALLASATGELRKQIEKDLEGKSEDEAAIKAMDEVIGLKAVRVLNRELGSQDTATLTAVFEERSQTQAVTLLLKKIGDEWKVSGQGR